jgi:hypothetical protein
MVYLRTVFAVIACKEASLCGVASCLCTLASTFYKLLEIERSGLSGSNIDLFFPSEKGGYAPRGDCRLKNNDPTYSW